ncbi:MAG TPA: 5'-3' exonuclease H3TH domain-containing protein [Vicinamibacteria bacterium]|nr:5'-3' exonuclease H3TH domain-containing protein [Vicinamibacteria bacterium]
MKVHLVDGTYELFRAFYGAPKRTGASGREVGAAAGLLRSFLFLLSGEDVTHVAVAFDHVIESFRNDLYPGYKTGEGVDPELLAQFDLAEDVSRTLGLVTWPMVEFEADDAIATAALRFSEDARVEQVVIASPDKDLTQCVRSDRIVCWDRMRGKVLDEEGVERKFGVRPRSIPDFLALVGDSADGLPGVFGWGKKSTSVVLTCYPHIEDIPENASTWKVKPRRAYDLAAELRHAAEAVRLYRQLATLRTDVPLTETLEDMQWVGAHRERLERLCEEIGEQEALERVSRWR